jgi:hypothetical protein
MISWHKHCDIFDAWLCEGVLYHTSGGISSLLTTYDHLWLTYLLTYKISLPFLGPILIQSAHLTSYMT